jgi:hypothetical protein
MVIKDVPSQVAHAISEFLPTDFRVRSFRLQVKQIEQKSRKGVIFSPLIIITSVLPGQFLLNATEMKSPLADLKLGRSDQTRVMADVPQGGLVMTRCRISQFASGKKCIESFYSTRWTVLPRLPPTPLVDLPSDHCRPEQVEMAAERVRCRLSGDSLRLPIVPKSHRSVLFFLSP